MTTTMGYDFLFPSKYGGVKIKLGQPQCAAVLLVHADSIMAPTIGC